MPTKSPPALSVAGLTVRYGAAAAVTDLSLDVDEGEFVSIIGANGAGKSTLLRAVSGILRPAAGRICLHGTDVTGWDPARIVARGLVHVPEGRELFGAMTVQENLELGAIGRGHRMAIPPDIWDLFPRLRERRRQRADSMSGGEQQMLAIARGLVAEPRVLLLDEPSLGLAPVIIQQIIGVLRDLNKSGLTIVLVEQNARLALSLSDRAYVLDVGRVKVHGPAESLANNDEVRRAYLGFGHARDEPSIRAHANGTAHDTR